MIVGLTGGIASGKSCCSNYFAAQGMSIIDADIIAREIVAPGSPLLLSLVDMLGQRIINSNEELNRHLLRQIIFSDERMRQRVNALMHPAIHLEIQRQILAYPISELVLLVAPLLLENCLDKLCKIVVVVDVPIELQIARGSARDGVSAADIKKIIATQISREKRLLQANFIIDNSISHDNTQQQCISLYEKLCWLNCENHKKSHGAILD